MGVHQGNEFGVHSHSGKDIVLVNVPGAAKSSPEARGGVNPSRTLHDSFALRTIASPRAMPRRRLSRTPGREEAVERGNDTRIGAEVAGYRIESLLGRGGMSVVYLAEHMRLGRKVALKLLSSVLSEDEGFRDRFVRESRRAAELDHPNIVPIYDAGESDGQLYIAMRYIQGCDLKTLIGREEHAQDRTLAVHPRAGRERARRGARPRPDPSRCRAREHPDRGASERST